jgi:hypothetical protein
MIDHDTLKTLLDYDPEAGVFRRKTKWGRKNIGDEPGCLSPQGYWQIGLLGKTYPAHRLAWLYYYGVWPENDIDHINRNRADNRIVNLRAVTRSTNLHNSSPSARNSSGILGVNPSRRPKLPWEARISIEYRQVYLGAYATKEEAAAAHEGAKRVLGLK